MKMEKLISPTFNQAIVSVSQKTNTKGSFNLKKIRRAIQENVENYFEVYNEVIKKYSELDEKGNPKLKPKSNFILFKADRTKSPAEIMAEELKNEADFHEEMKPLKEKEIKFEHKITCSTDIKPGEEINGDEAFFLDDLITE